MIQVSLDEKLSTSINCVFEPMVVAGKNQASKDLFMLLLAQCMVFQKLKMLKRIMNLSH